MLTCVNSPCGQIMTPCYCPTKFLNHRSISSHHYAKSVILEAEEDGPCFVGSAECSDTGHRMGCFQLCWDPGLHSHCRAKADQASCSPYKPCRLSKQDRFSRIFIQILNSFCPVFYRFIIHCPSFRSIFHHVLSN